MIRKGIGSWGGECKVDRLADCIFGRRCVRYLSFFVSRVYAVNTLLYLLCSGWLVLLLSILFFSFTFHVAACWLFAVAERYIVVFYSFLFTPSGKLLHRDKLFLVVGYEFG